MQNKHKISAFDITLFFVFLALAFIFWSFVRAISLVQPATEFEFKVRQPVEATSQEEAAIPEAEPFAAKDKLENQLDEVIKRFVKKQPNEFGIYVKHLESGVSAEHNGQIAMTMASLYKPFVAVEALKLADKGLLDLPQAVTDDGHTLDRCIERSITVSDNPCGLALLNATSMGGDYGFEKLKTLGYEHTDLRGYFPESTPRDIASFFENVYLGKDMSADAQRMILEVLSGQKINDRLSAGLPGKTDFAHKTGDLNGYAHDAGLVLDGQGGDYLIVVMSGPDDSGRLLDQRYADFGRLAESVHEIMVNYSLELASSSS